jgi:lysophospholipase L1-like esterase
VFAGRDRSTVEGHSHGTAEPLARGSDRPKGVLSDMTSYSRRRPCTGLVVSLACTVATALFVTPAMAGSPKFIPPKQYSLALGDSLAFGYQEAKFVQMVAAGAYDPAGFATGYIDVFAARLQTVRRGTTTVNYSCPGETSDTFINGGCFFRSSIPLPLHDDYPATTPQLTAALAFLRAHPSHVSPITVSLGADDFLLPYLFACNRSLACVEPAIPALLSQVRSNLEVVLTALDDAAPASEVIVIAYYNPFALSDPATTAVVQSLNNVVADVAAAHRARIADTFAVINAGPQPATLCSLTLMCAPFADLHPSDAGYAAMADRVWAAAGYDRLGED